MDKGIIVRGISGFYYVEINNNQIIECKARGIFRKDKISPIVGDIVEIEKIDEFHGLIHEIHPRKNQLIRPVVANVDQVVIIFALKKPEISFTLLDKLLISIENNNLDIIICLNKADIDDDLTFEKVSQIYENIGYTVIKTCGLTGEGINILKSYLHNKISVFAGPSGVGKSTIYNNLQSKIVMNTGTVSEKIHRGKHTTRHAELIEIDKNTYVVDTPGFSSIDLNFIECDELQYYFKEFTQYLNKCKFTTCLHNKENNCEIKNQVEEGNIPKARYDAYVDILNELMEKKKFMMQSEKYYEEKRRRKQE